LYKAKEGHPLSKNANSKTLQENRNTKTLYFYQILVKGAYYNKQSETAFKATSKKSKKLKINSNSQKLPYF
jgi:hypothetical protein